MVYVPKHLGIYLTHRVHQIGIFTYMKWLIFFNGFHVVGEYTNPMDPMGLPLLFVTIYSYYVLFIYKNPRFFFRLHTKTPATSPVCFFCIALVSQQNKAGRYCHGNPQPSLLRVITHILYWGFKIFIFHGFWGPRVDNS